ncbi:unnamed protein product [Boreogadus saida]
MLVLLGCYANVYPCCSWDYLHTLDSRTSYNHTDWVMSNLPMSFIGAGRVHTFVQTHSCRLGNKRKRQVCEGRTRTNTHTEKILTSRSVNVKRGRARFWITELFYSLALRCSVSSFGGYLMAHFQLLCRLHYYVSVSPPSHP